MKKLFLLDGMALVYRAHFALAARPIYTSRGVNTSALYGFTQTLLELLTNQEPTHVAVVFDTDAPTQRHAEYAEYKATRQAMPEDLSQALPHVRRMIEAFRIPIVTCDGYEADDLIGTLVRRAEPAGFTSYMVTPDKDFGQLVTERTFLYRPSRMGDAVEIIGIPEVKKRWGIERPEQVIDVLALMGDSIDNVPGVPGIGEKTASKLIAQYGTVENLLAHTSELTGRLKENLEKHREAALLSKRLVTLDCHAPCELDLESFQLRPRHDEQVKALFVEFEFNSIGKRLYGDAFKAGRGYPASSPAVAEETGKAAEEKAPVFEAEGVLEKGAAGAALKRRQDVPYTYRGIKTRAERAGLLARLLKGKAFAFEADVTQGDPKSGRLVGLAFSTEPHRADYVVLPEGAEELGKVLGEFGEVWRSEKIEKVGHNLKYAVSALKWRGVDVCGPFFDGMIAHSLIEPEMRHTLEYLSEACLGYQLGSTAPGEAQQGQFSFAPEAGERVNESVCETADLSWQLREVLRPLLTLRKQDRVFYEIEAPLIRVLVDMEYEGIRVEAPALAEFSAQLTREMAELEQTLCRLAGSPFNVNSPRQLGEVLFEVLKICEKPKKTRTGQYATDEQTLAALAPDHEIVRRLLEYRALSKLKSTYADALPAAIYGVTGRIHTTYQQTATSTGRLNSQNPNLQNIPIRRDRGQEIRKAFVSRDKDYLLLSADYSQIELRIIAALSREAGLLEAFRTGVDVHTATAAKVYGVGLEAVNAEMRRKAKMVNYGIAYGISAFGLAQRLSIPRKEASQIIEQYFAQFPGIRRYMNDTIAFAKEHGYVETVTGRRRYLRDIRSANATVRAAAERNAINMPIQGTAADMIKVAMIRIHRALWEGGLRTRMLLQVHDELVFDLYRSERDQVLPLVEQEMKRAIPLEVPIEIEMGTGDNWLTAH